MQTEKTKKFIEACEKLVESGEVKNYAEIISALGWEKSIFSNVKNGRKNVPNYIFKKFSEVYHPLDEEGMIHMKKTDQEIIEERGERLFALEVAMKALTEIVLDQQQELFKQTFSQVSNLWDEKIAQAHKLLIQKLRNE